MTCSAGRWGSWRAGSSGDQDSERGLGGIAYRIVSEKCAAVPWLCGDCRPECPNAAISTAHVVDPTKCTECVGAYPSPHCVDLCPAGACVPDEDRRETREQLLDKWRRLHPDEEPAPGTF